MVLRHYRLILFVACLVLGAHTLRFGYVFDDLPVLVNRPAVHQGLRGLPELFTTDLFADHYRHQGTEGHLQAGRYHPLLPASVALEVTAVGSLRPGVSHLTQILLYALCVSLVFSFLVRRVDPLPAFPITLLFTVMPLHVEIWCNIKSRDELLCLLGILTCLLLWKQRPKLATGAALLALLAKEYALFLPLFLWLAGEKIDRRAGVRLAGVFLVYAALRYHAIGLPGGNESIGSMLNNPFRDATTAETWGTFLALWPRYLGKLVLQWPLACDYSFAQIPMSGLRTLPAIGGAALLSAVLIAAWKGSRATRLALSFVLLPLLLVNNPWTTTGSMFAERFLFLPSFGLVLLLAPLLAKRPKWIWLPIAVALPLSLLRSLAWENESTLFSTDVRTVPHNALMQHNFGVVTQDPAPVRKALLIYPAYAEAKLNLGLLLLDTSPVDLREVEALWTEARAAMPGLRDWPAFDTRLASTHVRCGIEEAAGQNPQTAEAHFRRALQLAPRHMKARAMLADLLEDQGDKDAAVELRMAIPDSLRFPREFPQ